MPDPADITQLLVRLLTVHSPEFGSRLKQRLNAVLEESGLNHFNERELGYKKFHEFLERVPGDLFSVERPDGKGDILVSLKAGTASSPALSPASQKKSTAQAKNTPHPIRNEVWQAFSNPDVARRRFLHKKTYAVRHYLIGENSPFEQEIEKDSKEYVEIPRINGETQKGWTADFLKNIDLPASERSALDAMIAAEYTSGINAAFTRALGEHGKAWRRYRTRLVTEVIDQWAEHHAIPLEQLRAAPKTNSSDTSTELTLSPSPSAREQAVKLLELIAEEDISRLILPTLLSTILIRSRL